MDAIVSLLFPANSYGCLSLAPPVVAILLAVYTHRVVWSLVAGVFVGALIVAGGNPFAAVYAAAETHLWHSLIDESHLRVFAFTITMGALVGVMQRGGGMTALVQAIAPLARGRRGGQLTVWLLGLIVFFDDYANSLLLGSTMRPLTDRLRISREKLAYLVDSTAAPVSGLALISTWVAGEIGNIQDGLDKVDLATKPDAFSLLLETMPYRFYVWWALLFVPLVALLNREFGPMWHAERKAATSAPPSASDAAGVVRNGHWLDVVLPVCGVVAATVALILWTGAAAVAQEHLEPNLRHYFGRGDSYFALVYASLIGLAGAMLLARFRAGISWGEIKSAALEGGSQVMTAIGILWSAWALSGLTRAEYLGTGQYLGSLVSAAVDPRWLPTVVFVLASAVSFATGTSWGTMSILMPLVVPAACAALEPAYGAASFDTPLFVATVGCVLAGAIFGDHCSPISDTTVLSSQASSCDHMAHVRTQMPYALAVAGVSIVFGTLPVGFGVPVWPMLAAGTGALVAILFLFGRQV